MKGTETPTASQQQTMEHPSGHDLERIVDYDVLDKNNSEIGIVSAFWADQSGKPAFIGVRTFRLVGKTHVVPAEGAEVSHSGKHVRVPYSNEEVKGAPNYDPDAELDEAKEREVMAYYRARRPGLSYREGYQEEYKQAGQPGTTGQAPGEWPEASAGLTGKETQAKEQRPAERAGAEETRIPVHEEELAVGKRQVEMGGIRLRKIVHTETVQQPVEVKREHVEIEHVPPGEQKPSGKAFQGEEIYVPLWREEPVVSKETRVSDEIRMKKTQEKESKTVSGEVRKEEVKVEDERKKGDR